MKTLFGRERILCLARKAVKSANCILKIILSAASWDVATSELNARADYLQLPDDLRLPKTAAARTFYAHAIARCQLPASFGSEFFLAAVAPNDKSTADCAFFAAIQSVRR